MRIDNIHIQNFRCFTSYEVSFAEKTTVLIGKNGTGKTNLIFALKQGMSFIFSKNKVKGLQPFSTSGDLHVVKFEPMDANYDNKKRDFNYPIELNYNGVFEEQTIEWTFAKNYQTGTILSGKYVKALKIFLEHFNKDVINTQLPILAFFSDSYPHNKINIGKYARSILDMKGSLPRNFGYYQWDAETNCAEIWQNQYIKVYNSVNDFKTPLNEKKNRLIDLYLFLENDPANEDSLNWELESKKLKEEISSIEKESVELKEINFIEKKIKLFTKVLREDLNFINKEFEINKVIVERPKGLDNHQIQFVFSSEKAIYFDSLPQGYKRLISMVFDIAYRSYILNGEKEPKGIVFIDEVELHLHPTLAQEVLERFRRTFPEIQFVVSTHSPLVISNLKTQDEFGSNKVIKLINEEGEFKNETVENIYGIDYITSLMEIMDATYRPSTIDKLIDMYVAFKARNKEQEAILIYEKIRAIFNGEPNHFIKEEIQKKLESYQ
jgi:predicted ATP-binding protein involved in virulence